MPLKQPFTCKFEETMKLKNNRKRMNFPLSFGPR